VSRPSPSSGATDAVVLGVSLTYVTVRTDEGLLKIPNSVMLAPAVGSISPNEQKVPGGG
jgi:hypothetical protein